MNKITYLNRSLLSVFQPGKNSYPEISSDSFTAEWESPSNIALVKYWGKKAGQLPANPSLSMTLSKAVTHTSVVASESKVPGNLLIINGDPDHPFAPKLLKLFHWLVSEIPVLGKYSFQVTTANTFPHSAGIASSASGISAFSLCLLTIIPKITGKEIPADEFYKIASFVSRMGSGSACRSIYSGFSVWGRTPGLHDSSDLFALPINDRVHRDFMKLRDAILVVSSSPKTISSSLGHELMKDHPYAGVRIDQAKTNIQELLKALESGDIDKLAAISENEALTLHSLIMTSAGGTILLEPGSIAILKKIQQARQKGIPVLFSLDAGPNVHILYPENCCDSAEKFIREELLQFCENGQVIFDLCGEGPVLIESEDHPIP